MYPLDQHGMSVRETILAINFEDRLVTHFPLDVMSYNIHSSTMLGFILYVLLFDTVYTNLSLTMLFHCLCIYFGLPFSNLIHVIIYLSINSLRLYHVDSNTCVSYYWML